MTARELAELVIQVLDAQKKYFRTRKREDMIASMELEKKLREAANECLKP